MPALRMVIAGGIAAALLVSASAWVASVTPSETPEAPSGLSATPRVLDGIPPGTHIEDGPPQSWTHLIFKTRSVLSSGDVDKVSPLAASLSKLLFTAMIARVTPDAASGGKPYRLDKAAIGAGARIGKDDVIITSPTQRQLGARLGVLEMIVLSCAENRVQQVVQVGRSDTMLIVDSPQVMLDEGRHKDTFFRWVFLVDPDSGDLARLVWLLDADRPGERRLIGNALVRVNPDLVATIDIHVDAQQTTLGIPTEKAFAATRMPAGTAMPIPEAMRSIAAEKELTLDAVRQYEKELRQAIGFPQPR